MEAKQVYKLIREKLGSPLADLGFRRSGPRRFVRAREGADEVIEFFLHRFAERWHVELEKRSNHPPVVQLRHLVNPLDRYPWWGSESPEQVADALDQVHSMILSHGLKWFDGDIDFWELLKSANEKGTSPS